MQHTYASCVLLMNFVCASHMSVFYIRFTRVCSRYCTRVTHVFSHTYYAQSQFTCICLAFHTHFLAFHACLCGASHVCFACCVCMCHSHVPLVSFVWASCVMRICFLCDMLLCFTLPLASTVCIRKSMIYISHRGSNPI